MPADVRAFFDRYRDAFNRLDHNAVSACYDQPAMIAHAGGNGVFLDQDALNANNVALCKHYADSGFVQADFETRTFVAQNEDFCVADLAWTIHRRNREPECFSTSYALARRSGAWKVFCVTAYAEKRNWDKHD